MRDSKYTIGKLKWNTKTCSNNPSKPERKNSGMKWNGMENRGNNQKTIKTLKTQTYQ